MSGWKTGSSSGLTCLMQSCGHCLSTELDAEACPALRWGHWLATKFSRVGGIRWKREVVPKGKRAGKSLLWSSGWYRSYLMSDIFLTFQSSVIYWDKSISCWGYAYFTTSYFFSCFILVFFCGLVARFLRAGGPTPRWLHCLQKTIGKSEHSWHGKMENGGKKAIEQRE